MPGHRKPRELTGRHVLLCLLGFFGAVFAVNAVMIKVATSTFGGVQTASSYRAGLMFEQDVSRAEQQNALHWAVDGSLTRDSAGDVVLEVSARDAKGKPLLGLAATARLAHPADERRDHFVTLLETGEGRFRGRTGTPAGQWELIIDLSRGDTRMFRSRSRVTLR
ncbi:MAG TPA: FixH family protein [Pseudolabrys sp.]|nr:FixH family protein [Pseudolabrys sp.]